MEYRIEELNSLLTEMNGSGAEAWLSQNGFVEIQNETLGDSTQGIVWKHPTTGFTVGYNGGYGHHCFVVDFSRGQLHGVHYSWYKGDKSVEITDHTHRYG